MHVTPTSPSAVVVRVQNRRDQSGSSLIEVILAVLIAGSVVLSLAIGMLAVVRTNALTAEQEQADAGLGSFAESLRAVEYLPCDDSAVPGTFANYQSQYDLWAERWNPRAGMTAEVIDAEYWNGSDAYVENCPGDDRGAQRLTLQVTWGDTERQTHIVKRQR